MDREVYHFYKLHFGKFINKVGGNYNFFNQTNFFEFGIFTNAFNKATTSNIELSFLFSEENARRGGQTAIGARNTERG